MEGCGTKRHAAMMMVFITLMLVVVAAEGERSDRYLFCAKKCDSKYKEWRLHLEMYMKHMANYMQKCIKWYSS